MKEQFSDVVKAISKSLISELYTCLPGRIESYDPSTKKANVKPLLKRQMSNGDILERPVIVNTPVVFLSSSDSIISIPLKKGDGCLILFSQRSLDTWLDNGGDVLPNDPRQFDLSDAICIPGLFSFKEPGRVPSGENIEIYNDSGSVEIQGNSDFAVRFSALETAYNQLKTDFDNLVSIFNAHIHTTTATVGSSAVLGVISPTVTPGTPSTGDISGAKVDNVLLP